MTKRKGRTIAELMRELESDPQWVAQERERELLRSRQEATLREAERPLVNELSTAGVAVTSVWDLVNTATPYPDAVPVLLRHLHRPYPERIREGIARALAVPDARIGWGILVDAFENEKDQTTYGVKAALGFALAAIADDAVLDEVIALVRERKHGGVRVALLGALKKSRRPKARATLLELRGDSDLAKEIDRILRGVSEL